MWNYDNSLNNYVEGIILTKYLDKYSVYRKGLSEACITQILTGGGEIWDCEDRNVDSRTTRSHTYLVPTRVGSSGCNYHPVGTTPVFPLRAFMACPRVNLTFDAAVAENCRVSILYVILSIKIKFLCQITLEKKNVH